MKVKLQNNRIVDAVERNGRFYEILGNGQRPLHPGSFAVVPETPAPTPTPDSTSTESVEGPELNDTKLGGVGDVDLSIENGKEGEPDSPEVTDLKAEAAEDSAAADEDLAELIEEVGEEV